MKHVKLFEAFISEGKWSKIMTGVKKGAKSGPWAIVVIKDNKVISQTQVDTMDAIPAFYEDVKKKYPTDRIRIEDNEGMIVYNESVVAEAKGKDLIQVKKLDWVDHTRLIKFVSKEFGKLDITVTRTGGYTIDPSGLSGAEVEILLDYLRYQKYIIEQKVDEALKVKELDTLIDVLANLEDAFTEEEFVEFGVADLDMPQSTMMDIWDTYWNLSAQERLRYSTQDWAKWLKKNHSVI